MVAAFSRINSFLDALRRCTLAIPKDKAVFDLIHSSAAHLVSKNPVGLRPLES
jgi:hypothetical protein